MDSNSTLLAISLVEAVALEKVPEAQAICAVTTDADRREMVQFLSTILDELLTSRMGLTPAIEELSRWRVAALAGAADA